MTDVEDEARPLEADTEGTPAPDGPAADERVRRPAELWRIEGALAAVRAEVGELAALDNAALRERLAGLERRWRTELVAVLPESVEDELHRYFDWLGDAGAGLSELRVGLAQLAGWLDGLTSVLTVPIEDGGSP